MIAIFAYLAGACGSKTGLEVPDSGVDAAMLDAGVDAEIPCIEVPPPDGGPIEVAITTEAEIGRADVVFLIDTTASMQDEIDRVREQLRDRIAPAVQAEIPDAQFAVAIYEDFPREPYGENGDHPFTLMLPMTADISEVQAAMDAVELGNGRDEPESQVEALYQLATGEGLTTDESAPELRVYVPASLGCPTGGYGYACFRSDALPIILLFTDAPMHNGPGMSEPYSNAQLQTTPHIYADALDELVAIGARVIGFDSGEGRDGEGDLRQLARDTDTLDGSGDPLVYDIGRRGEGLGTGVVDAMKVFAGSVVFDIDAFAVDPDVGDGIDSTRFIDAILPLRAEPMSGIESIDVEAGVFRGVRSGTGVVFQLRIRNEVVQPGPEPQRFRVEIVFRGDGRTRLGSQIVEIVVPALDGEGCDEDDNEGAGS